MILRWHGPFPILEANGPDVTNQKVYSLKKARYKFIRVGVGPTHIDFPQIITTVHGMVGGDKA